MVETGPSSSFEIFVSYFRIPILEDIVRFVQKIKYRRSLKRSGRPLPPLIGGETISGIAGFTGGIIWMILFAVYLSDALRDRPELMANEIPLITVVYLLVAGPFFGVLGGRVAISASKNVERTSTRIGGGLIGGFLAGLLYVSIALPLF